MVYCFRRIGILALVFAGLAPFSPFAPAARADEEYSVRLTKPSKVGDTYGVSALTAMRVTSTVRLPDAQPEERVTAVGVHLEGQVKVLEADDKGHERRVACTVTRCTQTNGQAAAVLVRAGKVIVAERKGDKTHYWVRDNAAGEEGAEAPKEFADSLELVIDLDDPRAASDDEVFGTDEKKKVGDSWPVNADAATRDLELQHLSASKDDTSGTAKLADVSDVDGVKVLDMKLELATKNLGGQLPDEGLKVTGGQMHATVDEMVPADNSTGPLSQNVSVKISTSMTGKDPDGKALSVESTIERSEERKYTYAKK